MVKTRRSTAPEDIVVPIFSNELANTELQYNRQHTALCKLGCQIVHHELVLAIDITTNYQRSKDKESPSLSKLVLWRRKVSELDESLNRWCLTAEDVNSTVPDGEELLQLPILHLACVLLKYKALSLFLESGFDPTVTAKNGDNALFSFVRTFATARREKRCTWRKCESVRQVAHSFCTIIEFLTNKEPGIVFTKDRDGNNILQLLVEYVTETIHDIRDSSTLTRKEEYASRSSRVNLTFFKNCAQAIVERLSHWRDVGRFKEGLLIGFLKEVNGKGRTILESLEQDYAEFWEVQELATYILKCFPTLNTTTETIGCDWQEEGQIPYISTQQQGNHLVNEVNSDLLAVTPGSVLSSSSAEETQQDLSISDTPCHSYEQQVLNHHLRGSMHVTSPAINMFPAANVSLFQQAAKEQAPPFAYYFANSPKVFTVPPSVENQTQFDSSAHSMLEQRSKNLQMPVASPCNRQFLYAPSGNAGLQNTEDGKAEKRNLEGSKEIPISPSIHRSASTQDPTVTARAHMMQSSYCSTEVLFEEGKNIPVVEQTGLFEVTHRNTGHPSLRDNFLQCSSTQSQSETLNNNSEQSHKRHVAVQSAVTAAVSCSSTQLSTCFSTGFTVASGSPVQNQSGTNVWSYTNNRNAGNTVGKGQDNPRKKIRLDITSSKKMHTLGRRREKTSSLSTGNPLVSQVDSSKNTLTGSSLIQPHGAMNDNEDMIATITSSTKSPEPPADNSFLHLVVSQGTSLTPDTKEEMIKLMRRDFNTQLDSVQTKLAEVICHEQGVEKQLENEAELLRLKEKELENLRSQVNQSKEIARSLRKSRRQLEKKQEEWKNKLLQCYEIQK